MTCTTRRQSDPFLHLDRDPKTGTPVGYSLCLPGANQQKKELEQFRRRLLDYVRLLPEADLNVKLQENH
jgi:hypothetical protein